MRQIVYQGWKYYFKSARVEAFKNLQAVKGFTINFHCYVGKSASKTISDEKDASTPAVTELEVLQHVLSIRIPPLVEGLNNEQTQKAYQNGVIATVSTLIR